MPMNKCDIINEINKLTAELPLVKKVAEISEHEGLEIAFNELTEKCCSSIKVKNFKTGKDYIKELEIINSFKRYLEGQNERIKRIETRIAELKIDLTKYQLSLFEEKNQGKIDTGISFQDKELFSGDVFETSSKEYLLIAESEEHPTNFCITGTAFTEELLLQYPKNREILNNTAYLGNMYDDDKLAEFLAKLEEKQEELQNDENDEADEEGKE